MTTDEGAWGAGGSGGDGPPVLDADAVAVLLGSTFVISDPSGDVREGSVAGFFHQDTRLLSKYELTVEDAPPVRLSVGQSDHPSATFFMTNPELASAPAGTISIARHRRIDGGRMREDISLQSHLPRPVALVLRLSFAADFADLFEVKERGRIDGGGVQVRADPGRRLLRFDFRDGSFSASTVVVFSRRPGFRDQDAVFEVELEPRGSWTVNMLVRPDHHEEDPKRRARPVAVRGEFDQTPDPGEWREAFPELQCDSDALERIYRRSVDDLAILRLPLRVRGEEVALPAAGMPWFMTIFGRDTLITSHETLLWAPDLAAGALGALAALQGARLEDFTDEQPGRILHEIRFGKLTVLGATPHDPYYGTIDATPLWLTLLGRHWQVSGDDGLARRLRAPALRALQWIDRFGDRDGDGYVEYATQSTKGLANQGWKDSGNGILFADGTAAAPPVALCEVQGYVYAAKMHLAEIAEEVWEDPALAERLRGEAGDLFDRFNRDLWLDRRGGFYALGLDRNKRPIDSMTSNMGHLLWSGIVPKERAPVVVARLLSDEMFSGWGIRTVSSQEAGFNPIAYHTGSVWPHDNALICAGLARYGFRDEANRVVMGLLEAASHLGDRLAEVFAGYPRASDGFPVRCPTASSPQAWASAAPFLWLQVMLGLDVRGGTLVCDPLIPTDLGVVQLEGIPAGGRRFNVRAQGASGTVTETGLGNRSRRGARGR